MKICFFTSTLSKGGAERVISNLSNFLINDKQIEKIDILTVYNTDIAYKLDNRIHIDSLDKKYVEYKKLVNNQKRLKKLFIHIKKFFKNITLKINLKKKVKKFNYDIIITFLPEPSFLILSLKKYIKSPIIISDRNDPNVEYARIREKYLMKKLYPRADGFVFQTDDAKRYFDKIFTKKCEIIPNPVNDNFVVEPYEGIREKYIVNVGRLEEQKNQLLLVKAFEKIRDDLDNYKLIIYGEGSLKKQLEDYILEKNLKEDVILGGQVDDVKEKIYKSSLFVLSSNYEGMPNALIEAMCLGLPVISTDCPCGGPRMLIENNENGILVPIKNENKMAKAIKEILQQKQFAKKLGDNASKLSVKLSNEVINNKWLEFIKKVIKEGK
jgi:glycosyltransferase involved in cell wall biosynthesis